MGRSKLSKREVDESFESYKNEKMMKRGILSRETFNRSNVVLTDKQNILFNEIRRNTLTIVHGPAGTSKTFTACYTALSLLAEKKIEQIVITKPNVESGPTIGLLPGTIREKVDPYKQSYYTNFCKIIDKSTVDLMFSADEIKFEPLSYMRGSTYDNCLIMLDECQNSTITQLMLWSTRLGKESKAVMMGDTSQYDVKKRDSGYINFIEMTRGMDDLATFQFGNEDIVRNKFLIELTNRYDKYRYENEN
jgi:phosphate starvation-inducible PhoH-like protein